MEPFIKDKKNFNVIHRFFISVFDRFREIDQRF